MKMSWRMGDRSRTGAEPEVRQLGNRSSTGPGHASDSLNLSLQPRASSIAVLLFGEQGCQLASRIPRPRSPSSRASATRAHAAYPARHSPPTSSATRRGGGSALCSSCNRGADARSSHERRPQSCISATRCQADPATFFRGAGTDTPSDAECCGPLIRELCPSPGYGSCSSFGALCSAGLAYRIVALRLEMAERASWPRPGCP